MKITKKHIVIFLIINCCLALLYLVVISNGDIDETTNDSTESTSNIEVNIDASGVAIFWEVVDTLSSDKKPSQKLWDRFANHHAYVQIQRNGNRVTYLKRILPIVFMPSKSETLDKVLNGKESLTQYFATHLQEIKLNRQKLYNYLGSNNIESYKDAYLKSLKYLPEDINEDAIDLTIYVALFEDNGFGGKVITVDLLHLLKNTDEENKDFLAHEFHHALRSKSNTYKVTEPNDTTNQAIFRALNKLPLEGVASLIDKKKYMANNEKEEAIEFRELIKEADKNLRKIDLALAGNLSTEEKGEAILKSMPWGGHSVGFYLASAIEDKLGLEALIKSQYSCVDFILTYQNAAGKDKNLYRFSDEAITFLKTIK
ncbi:MAG: DUF5700 domain-containing putative Zn-dependent protease [Cyclobacteriaceae bacterium]